jgi:hypothetical protein
MQLLAKWSLLPSASLNHDERKNPHASSSRIEPFTLASAIPNNHAKYINNIQFAPYHFITTFPSSFNKSRHFKNIFSPTLTNLT